MAALDFPDSSASPWTAPNGVIYTWNTDGYWEAKADPNDFDTDYLKLDASNDPVTGTCEFSAGVSVTDGFVAGGKTRAIEASSSTGTDAVVITANSSLDLNSYVGFTSYAPGNVADLTHFSCSQSRSSTYATVKGFSATNNLINGTTASYGFWSDISIDDGPANYNFYAAGNAPSFFQGVTEHAAGVKVTGGDAASVSKGFYSPSSDLNQNLDIAVNSLISARFANSVSEPGGRRNFTGFTSYPYNGITESAEIVYGNVAQFQGGDYTSTNNLVGFYTKKVQEGNVTGRVVSYKGFEVAQDTGIVADFANTSYGFYSGLNSYDRDTYNFFASGSAPNFFAGGVQFATAAGTKALSHYEEGSFILNLQKAENINGSGETPVAITNEFSEYIIVGNQVHIQSSFKITNTDGSPIPGNFTGSEMFIFATVFGPNTNNLYNSCVGSAVAKYSGTNNALQGSIRFAGGQSSQTMKVEFSQATGASIQYDNAAIRFAITYITNTL